MLGNIQNHTKISCELHQGNLLQFANKNSSRSEPDTSVRNRMYQLSSQRLKTSDLSVLSGRFSFNIINIGGKY